MISIEETIECMMYGPLWVLLSMRIISQWYVWCMCTDNKIHTPQPAKYPLWNCLYVAMYVLLGRGEIFT